MHSSYGTLKIVASGYMITQSSRTDSAYIACMLAMTKSSTEATHLVDSLLDLLPVRPSLDELVDAVCQLAAEDTAAATFTHSSGLNSPP